MWKTNDAWSAEIMFTYIWNFLFVLLQAVAGKLLAIAMTYEIAKKL